MMEILPGTIVLIFIVSFVFFIYDFITRYFIQKNSSAPATEAESSSTSIEELTATKGSTPIEELAATRENFTEEATVSESPQTETPTVSPWMAPVVSETEELSPIVGDSESSAPEAPAESAISEAPEASSEAVAPSETDPPTPETSPETKGSTPIEELVERTDSTEEATVDRSPMSETPTVSMGMTPVVSPQETLDPMVGDTESSAPENPPSGTSTPLEVSSPVLEETASDTESESVTTSPAATIASPIAEETAPETVTEEETPAESESEPATLETSEEAIAPPIAEETAPETITEEETPVASESEPATLETSEEAIAPPIAEETAPETITQEETPVASESEPATLETSEEAIASPAAEETAPETVTEEKTPVGSDSDATTIETSEEAIASPIAEETAPETVTEEETPVGSDSDATTIETSEEAIASPAAEAAEAESSETSTDDDNDTPPDPPSGGVSSESPTTGEADTQPPTAAKPSPKKAKSRKTGGKRGNKNKSGGGQGFGFIAPQNPLDSTPSAQKSFRLGWVMAILLLLGLGGSQISRVWESRPRQLASIESSNTQTTSGGTSKDALLKALQLSPTTFATYAQAWGISSDRSEFSAEEAAKITSTATAMRSGEHSTWQAYLDATTEERAIASFPQTEPIERNILPQRYARLPGQVGQAVAGIASVMGENLDRNFVEPLFAAPAQTAPPDSVMASQGYGDCPQNVASTTKPPTEETPVKYLQAEARSR